MIKANISPISLTTDLVDKQFGRVVKINKILPTYNGWFACPRCGTVVYKRFAINNKIVQVPCSRLSCCTMFDVKINLDIFL